MHALNRRPNQSKCVRQSWHSRQGHARTKCVACESPEVDAGDRAAHAPHPKEIVGISARDQKFVGIPGRSSQQQESLYLGIGMSSCEQESLPSPRVRPLPPTIFSRDQKPFASPHVSRLLVPYHRLPAHTSSRDSLHADALEVGKLWWTPYTHHPAAKWDTYSAFRQIPRQRFLTRCISTCLKAGMGFDPACFAQ